MKSLIISFILLMSCNQLDSKNKNLKTTFQQDVSTQKMENTDVIDTVKAKKSQAIIKAILTKSGVGDKYLWDDVRVIKVIDNKTKFEFPLEMKIASYSWKVGIPLNKECILYLTPYPFGSNSLNERNEWMLIDGDGKVGVQE